jgi:hypothetical protein
MSTDNNPAGFWSYTHRDDEIEDGRIRRLARKIANEFEGITAEELHVFIDKEDVKWGNEWRNRIDSALTGATFFMPIVTPRFFRSDECRREVLTFSGHAKSLGLEGLLLPILYFDVPQIRHTEGAEDEVIALVAKTQYEDWTALRLEDENSPGYRQAIHRLAVRLVEILEKAKEVEPPPVALMRDAEVDEEPGTLELMAEAEEALPRWAQVMEEFVETIKDVSEVVQGASVQVDRANARGGGFADRLRIAQELAKNLQPTADRMGELGNRYSAELVKIDPGILGIIRQVESEGINSDNERQVREFFAVLKDTAQKARAGMPGVQVFYDSLTDISAFSKAIRPLAAKMRNALQQVMDGQAILDEWERRIDEVSGE